MCAPGNDGMTASPADAQGEESRMQRATLLQRLAESHRAIEPDQDVHLGLFRPEDAQGIALAYYETYGDTFPLDHVYDPEEIVRRNATNDQYTVVARTPKGEIVGLFGLFRHAPNPGVYEAGQLMVLKSYRKRDVGKMLSQSALNSLPEQLGIPVVVCEAVSNHPVSQHLSLEEGMSFTGLELECMPSRDTVGKDGVSHNISLFLMFKVFDSASCDVCLPEAYRAFCQGVYEEMALPRVALPPKRSTGATMASRFFLQEIGLLRLTVTRVGRDFGECVGAAEAQAGERGLVQLCLNLGDAGVPEAVTALRDRGYFLGGVLPFWFGADGLLMQKLRREPDWDAIHGAGPKAAAMQAQIRQDFEAANRRGHAPV